VFAGIDDVMHGKGYDISLYQHINDAETRDRFFTVLPVLRNVDAVFVASFAIEPAEIEQLRRTKVPIVGINTPDPLRFDASETIDDEGGMYRAAQHMIKLGHKRIVYTCSAAAETLDASIDLRGHGFIRACERAQNTHDISWKVLTVPRGRDFADNALTAVLSEDRFPDAICCQMDMMAIPLMIKLARHGYRAPRDYSIIGFDDAPYADSGADDDAAEPVRDGAQCGDEGADAAGGPRSGAAACDSGAEARAARFGFAVRGGVSADLCAAFAIAVSDWRLRSILWCFAETGVAGKVI